MAALCWKRQQTFCCRCNKRLRASPGTFLSRVSRPGDRNVCSTALSPTSAGLLERAHVTWFPGAHSLGTFRTDARADAAPGMFLDIKLDPVPLPLVIEDLFASHTNGQQPVQSLDFLSRFLELHDQTFPLHRRSLTFLQET